MDRVEKIREFWEERLQYWEKWFLVQDLIQQLQYEHENISLSRVNEVAWQIVNATREE